MIEVILNLSTTALMVLFLVSCFCCSHDVAEIAGLTTFSFGEDEVDRYVMLFKKVTGMYKKQ